MNRSTLQPPQIDTYVLYLAMRVVASFAFTLVITYELVYHTAEIGLNPLQLVTVGVLLECMTLLFEIPTGVVADAYSRRLSILIGFLLIGLGFLIEGLISSFSAVLSAQILWGIGFTFYSGAGIAWITDEIGEEHASAAILRGTQLSQISSLLGVAAGAYLVSYGLRVPIVVGASIYIILVPILAWLMPETGFRPPSNKDGVGVWQKMHAPISQGIQLLRIRPVLILILLNGMVVGLYVGGFDRLNAAHFVENFTLPNPWNLEPVAWFSVMSGVISILSLLGTESVRRLIDVTQNTLLIRLLLTLYSCMIICTLVFALTQRFATALICYCIVQALRNVARPLVIIWVNQNTESSVRATVISMSWQSNALGQIMGSPVVGWVGVRYSLRAALATGALIYIAVIPLLYRANQVQQMQTVAARE